ncbi:MAG: HAMP domain-containing histidine kinase, partial [Coleofasciculus sp. S288]|nr:HAMP domain-containing histidine kinase [Coleofasciculus sp. S288]
TESRISLAIQCEDNQVIFQVRDWGMGIPQEDQPHLFEPFYRGENVGTIRGTGMGLAIVRKAVDLHGGTVSVESEIGIGTTFTVSLPGGRE